MFRSIRPTEAEIERTAFSPDGSPWAWTNDITPGRYAALALPAFYRGVSIRSSILSTLPLAIEIGGETQDFVPPIVEQPDPTEDRQETLSRMATSLATRGEFVAILGDFEDGFPNSMKVVDPTTAARQADGSWNITVELKTRNFSRDEVLYRNALAFAGESRGISVVELFRRHLDGELAAQAYQGQFYKDGGLPMAVVSVKQTELDETQLTRLAQTWREKVRRSREPVFLPGDFSVQPIYLSNRDAQFLESRTFSLTDIANMLGLPPYFLGASGASNTYSNISDQRRDLLDIYMRNDLYLIERAFSSLFPQGMEVKYQAESFLRLDPLQTANTLKIETGWMTVNEVRAVQGMPPLPAPIGDQLAAAFQPGGSGPAEPKEASNG